MDNVARLAIRNEALFLGQHGCLEVADFTLSTIYYFKTEFIVNIERLKVLDKPDTFYSTINFNYPTVSNFQRKKGELPLGLAVLQ